MLDADDIVDPTPQLVNSFHEENPRPGWEGESSIRLGEWELPMPPPVRRLDKTLHLVP